MFELTWAAKLAAECEKRLHVNRTEIVALLIEGGMANEVNSVAATDFITTLALHVDPYQEHQLLELDRMLALAYLLGIREGKQSKSCTC
jgi:hypothetical protein